MNTTLELTPPPTESRADRIWNIFVRLGQVSTRVLTEHCLAEKVWTVEEMDGIQFRACQDEVRRVLRKRDDRNLPKAGQTTVENDDGDTEVLWAPRQLWLFADYELNCREHWADADESNRVGDALADECEERGFKRPRRAAKAV